MPTTVLGNICAGCGELIANYPDTQVSMGEYGPDRGMYCPACHHWFNCDDCGAFVERGPDNFRSGRCDSCRSARYFTCPDCRELNYRAYARVCNGREVCNTCSDRYNTWDIPAWHNHSGESDLVGSTRSFGVEVETHRCADHMELNGSSAWGCKIDCSVQGREFVSAILSGNEGLDEIHALMEFADLHDWRVEETCGLHIHLDVEGESDASLFSAAAAYLMSSDVWRRFVDSDRRNNSYCHAARREHTVFSDYTTFYEFANGWSRYTWINFAALIRHSTFEVRLHHGSLDDKEICNWIRAHTTFLDWALKQDYDDLIANFESLDTVAKFRKICEVWTAAGCADLVEYYANRGRFEVPNLAVSNNFASSMRKFLVAGAARRGL